MDRIDTLVIGAGVVGLAVARALALQGREVIVVEREGAIGQGVSSRNSEVIHAGLYYPTASLKARLSVEGKDMLYRHCAERAVPVHNCGKLVVATHHAQLPKLHAIAAQAQANGVPVSLLTADEARAMEPNLHCTAALHSPTTGIVDSHALMLSLQADLEQAGGMVALASEVSGIRFVAAQKATEGENFEGNTQVVGDFIASVATKTEAMEFCAKRVVNAAGLFAPQVASRIQGLNQRHVPTAHFAKGHYFSLSGNAPFSRLIYPVPEPGGLGVHLTLDMGGQAKFGPDVQWLNATSPDPLDYAVDASRSEAFYAEVRKYWPALQDGALQPSYSGIRPKIVGPGQDAADFAIQGPRTHGLAGLVNLFGIESPGLTSALAIAKLVAQDMLAD
jgi:L-2-hydroxyglutarate oxidase LhgO